jgi:hypothetical protein
MRSEDEDFRRKSRQRVADDRAKRKAHDVTVRIGGPAVRVGRKGAKVRVESKGSPEVVRVILTPGALDTLDEEP